MCFSPDTSLASVTVRRGTVAIRMTSGLAFPIDGDYL